MINYVKDFIFVKEFILERSDKCKKNYDGRKQFEKRRSIMKKFRKLLTTFLLFVMVFSLQCPTLAIADVEATENTVATSQKEPGEQKQLGKQEQVEPIEDETITWTNKGEFPYVTSVSITDSDGTSIGEDSFDRNQRINLDFYFSIPNDVYVFVGGHVHHYYSRWI